MTNFSKLSELTKPSDPAPDILLNPASGAITPLIPVSNPACCQGFLIDQLYLVATQHPQGRLAFKGTLFHHVSLFTRIISIHYRNEKSNRG